MEARPLIAKVNDIDIAYNRWGEGNSKRIMLVPGWTCVKEVWTDIASMLAKEDFDVVAMDLRGSGDSSKPAGDYTLTVLANDLHELAKQLDWTGGFTMLGHSMGGAVLMDYTFRYPETLTHIIPANAGLGMPRPAITSRILWAFILGTFKKNPEKMLKIIIPHFFMVPISKEKHDWFLSMALKTDTSAGISQMQHCLAWNSWADLSNIKIPTMVVSAELEPRATRKISQRIHEMIPNSTLVTLRKTGHMHFMTHPEVLFRAIVDFVQ